MLRSVALFVSICSLAVVGCDKNTATRTDSASTESASTDEPASARGDDTFDLEDAVHRIDEDARQGVDLPALPYDATDAPQPGFLLIVEPDRVLLSQGPIVGAWAADSQPTPASQADFDDAKRGLLEQLDEFGVELITEPRVIMQLEDGVVSPANLKGGEPSLYMPPVYDSISDAVEEYKQAAKLLEQPVEMRSILVIDESTPWRTVTRLLFTSGQAELGAFQIVTAADDGSTKRMTLTSPKISLEPPSGEQQPDKVCARPSALVFEGASYLVVEEGVHGANAMQANEELDKFKGKSAEDLLDKMSAESAEQPADKPEARSWMGAVLVGPDGSCPTAKAGDEEGDVLRRVVSSFDAAPYCRSEKGGSGETRVMVAGVRDLPFGRAVAVMSALKSTDVFDAVTAGISPGSESATASRCDDAFPVAK